MATRTTANATAKKIRQVVLLLGRAGYNTVFVDANFKHFGATMSDGDRPVESWLANKDSFELDMLIERLSNETASDVRGRAKTSFKNSMKTR